MNRLREPSTWAGLAALGQLLASFLPAQYAWVGQIITAGAGAAAVKLREGAAP